MDTDPKVERDKHVEWCLTTSVGRGVPPIGASVEALRDLFWRPRRRPDKESDSGV